MCDKWQVQTVGRRIPGLVWNDGYLTNKHGDCSEFKHLMYVKLGIFSGCISNDGHLVAFIFPDRSISQDNMKIIWNNFEELYRFSPIFFDGRRFYRPLVVASKSWAWSSMFPEIRVMIIMRLVNIAIATGIFISSGNDCHSLRSHGTFIVNVPITLWLWLT